MSHYFTVAEANALLPLLRPHVRRLIVAWHRLRRLQPEVLALLRSHPGAELGGPPLSIATVEIIAAQNAIVAIQAVGAELKDPATGLLDFLARRRHRTTVTDTMVEHGTNRYKQAGVFFGQW